MPREAVLAPGQRVEWINNDRAAHTISAIRGAHFQSGRLATGARYTFTPPRVGIKITYGCGPNRAPATLFVGSE